MPPSNYRPISLTSVVVKTFERILHNELSKFLSENNLLSPSQHGFWPNHSCHSLRQQKIALHNKARVHIIFLDFLQGVRHGTSRETPRKRRYLWPTVKTGWKPYLTKRSQRVVIDGVSSDWATVTSGAPQGSILGPLLFLAYINDIGNGVSSCTKLFADDCALYGEVSNIKDAESLQRDLRTLSLFQPKCKAMQISNKKSTVDFSYRINTTALEWVLSFTC